MAKSLNNILIRSIISCQRSQVSQFFGQVFAEDSADDEGANKVNEAIANLADKLFRELDDDKILGYSAVAEREIIAGLFLSQLFFDCADKPNEPVYILGPVAVAPQFQQQKVGHNLIEFALAKLRQENYDLVIVYGDPTYYQRFGFMPIKQSFIKAPLPLSMPHGWQALSLQGNPIPQITAKPTCVAAFNDPVYW